MCPTKGAVFGKSWPLSHHVWLENKGFLQSISRKNDEYRKPKSDIILMNTLSIEGMFPGFPSCFQLYIVSCWIYFRFLAVFSNVPSCFSTFAAGLPISRFFFPQFSFGFPIQQFLLQHAPCLEALQSRIQHLTRSSRHLRSCFPHGKVGLTTKMVV